MIEIKILLQLLLAVVVFFYSVNISAYTGYASSNLSTAKSACEAHVIVHDPTRICVLDDSYLPNYYWCDAPASSPVATYCHLGWRALPEDCPIDEPYNPETGVCEIPSCDPPLVYDIETSSCGCAGDDEYYSVLNICANPECSNGTQRSTLTGVCPDDCPAGTIVTVAGDGSPPGTICHGSMGCEANRAGGVTVFTSTGYGASYKYTGYACAGGEDEPWEPFECPAGEVQKSCPGSSVSYCMASGTPLQCDTGPTPPGTDDSPGTSNPTNPYISSNTPTSTSTSSSTSTNDNGDGTSTKTTTTTKTITHSNGSTSTTTTTSSSVINNSTGEVVSTSETSSGDGGADGSADTVAGNNQCAQQPTCDGNAIQCAQLFNTWEQKCLLKATLGYCIDHPTDEQCVEEEVTALVEEEINLSLTPVAIASNATCPAGFTVNTNTAGMLSFDMSLVCDFMTLIRPIILIFAWIASAYIVISSVRSD